MGHAQLAEADGDDLSQVVAGELRGDGLRPWDNAGLLVRHPWPLVCFVSRTTANTISSSSSSLRRRMSRSGPPMAASRTAASKASRPVGGSRRDLRRELRVRPGWTYRCG